MKPEATFRVGSRIAWASVGILMLMQVLSYVDRSIISLMVDPIRRDLNISDFQLSLVQGLAFALFYAVCGIPMGWLIDRYSRRLIIFIGVMVWSIATASCGFANSYTALLVARFAVGAGEATLLPAGYSLIADMFPKDKLGRANGIFSASSLIGSSVALAVGGAAIAYAERIGPVGFPIVGLHKPWQVAFMAIGLPGMVIALSVFMMPDVPPAKRGQETDVGTKAFVRYLLSQKGPFTCAVFGFGFMAMLGYCLLTWFPAYMQRNFGMHIGVFGGIAGTVSAVGGILGAICAGLLLDRGFARGIAGTSHLLTIGAAFVMVALAVILFSADNAMVAFVFYGLILFFGSISGPAGMSYLQMVTPAEFRGRTLATYFLFYMLIVSGLGPSAVAFFTDFVLGDSRRVGTSIALTFCVFGPIAALLLSLGLKSPAARLWRKDPSVSPVAR